MEENRLENRLVLGIIIIILVSILGIVSLFILDSINSMEHKAVEICGEKGGTPVMEQIEGHTDLHYTRCNF